MNDRIPVVGHHRGVGLHDQQSPERLVVVRQAIDDVFSTSEAPQLLQIARDPSWPPEARLFAAAKLEAIHQLAVEDRERRPSFDLAEVHAVVAGLDSQRWRDPLYYGGLLEPGPAPGEQRVKRERPLDL